MSTYENFTRDEELKLGNAGVSDLAFNYEPICQAMSWSELEVTEEVYEAAESFCVCITDATNQLYEPNEIINDWLNRV